MYIIIINNNNIIISKRVDVCYMSSPIRLSVCRVSSVTFVRPVQLVEIFGSISSRFGTLAIHRHPSKILRRSSQGNPFVERVECKRDSRI